MAERLYGEIDGCPVGSLFKDRRELSAAGVHRPTMAGISGSGAEGADSIVLNGGYEDDEDAWDEVVYTGHGGNDPETGKQVADQELIRGNLALARSELEGLPVRVVRGWREPSGYGPPFGYRYDGLYRVEHHWQAIGLSKYLIWRYRLVREGGQAVPTDVAGKLAAAGPAPRQAETVQRIVRNTAATRRVKELHAHRCQACGLQLETPAGPYAEGAHIRPLGRPHDGPDVPANVLCLCPNHHVLFDAGAFVLGDDLALVPLAAGAPRGRLRAARGHAIDLQHVRYHRGLFEGR